MTMEMEEHHPTRRTITMHADDPRHLAFRDAYFRGTTVYLEDQQPSRAVVIGKNTVYLMNGKEETTFTIDWRLFLPY